MAENPRRKRQRLVTFAAAVAVLALVLPFIMAGTGTYLASAIQTNGVLSGDTGVAAIYSEHAVGTATETTQVAFADASGHYTWTQPANATADWIVTNLTASEMQGAAVSQITVALGDTGYQDMSIGFASNVSNPSSFVAYAHYNGASLTSEVITISASYLTGDGSAHFAIELTGTFAATYSFSQTARGLSGVSLIFGPYVAENIGYVLGAVLLIIFGTLSLVWLDLSGSSAPTVVLRWIARQGAEARRARARKKGSKGSTGGRS